MSSPSAEDVIDAFVDVIRDQLKEENAVEVPSFGTFAVEHRPSKSKEDEGPLRLAPPRNVVVFDPEQD